MREIMMIQTTMPLMKITMMDHNHCIPSTKEKGCQTRHLKEAMSPIIHH
jgi:hypothetical protein